MIDLNTMTRAMLRGMPDTTKTRTCETFYVDTGLFEEVDDVTGKRRLKVLADKDCSCGGRGFEGRAVPVGHKPVYIRCRCAILTSLSISFIIIPKKKK